jgi:hypothetical protein
VQNILSHVCSCPKPSQAGQRDPKPGHRKHTAPLGLIFLKVLCVQESSVKLSHLPSLSLVRVADNPPPTRQSHLLCEVGLPSGLCPSRTSGASLSGLSSCILCGTSCLHGSIPVALTECLETARGAGRATVTTVTCCTFHS